MSQQVRKLSRLQLVAQHVLGTRGSRHTAENHAISVVAVDSTRNLAGCEKTSNWLRIGAQDCRFFLQFARLKRLIQEWVCVCVCVVCVVCCVQCCVCVAGHEREEKREVVEIMKQNTRRKQKGRQEEAAHMVKNNVSVKTKAKETLGN